ncbi:MAG: hypothetical protein C0504_07405 [Candidatus Solibacter sp.]|nr:hypothetical protein [Candidatus Solibacter sp.]
MGNVTKRASPTIQTAAAAPAAVPYVRILVWLLATRVIVAMMAGFSSMVLEPGYHMGNASNLWQAFMRWDTGWFMSVVQQGYFFDPGRASNIPFMPLFPGLVWIFSLGRIIDPHVAGVLISNAALFYGCVSIWRITHRRWKSVDTADLSVILVLVSPVSFFLSIFYSEGLFLCAVAACLDEAERERWAYAGLWGMAAALTRNAGFLLVLPLLVYFLAPWSKPRQWRNLAWLFLPVLGSALFTLYLWAKFGDPQIYTKAQLFWSRQLAWPWFAFQDGYHNNFISLFYRVYFRGAALLALGMLALAAALRVRLAWVPLMIVWPLLYTSTTLLDSLPRYLATVVPYYPIAAAALTRWPVFRYPLLLWSAMMLMLSVALFVNGYWFV